MNFLPQGVTLGMISHQEVRILQEDAKPGKTSQVHSSPGVTPGMIPPQGVLYEWLLPRWYSRNASYPGATSEMISLQGFSRNDSSPGFNLGMIPPQGVLQECFHPGGTTGLIPPWWYLLNDSSPGYTPGTLPTEGILKDWFIPQESFLPRGHSRSDSCQE